MQDVMTVVSWGLFGIGLFGLILNPALILYFLLSAREDAPDNNSAFGENIKARVGGFLCCAGLITASYIVMPFWLWGMDAIGLKFLETCATVILITGGVVLLKNNIRD